MHKTKTVVISDGKAGKVENVMLDEFHGLRVSISGHQGDWPISTARFIGRTADDRGILDTQPLDEVTLVRTQRGESSPAS